MSKLLNYYIWGNFVYHHSGQISIYHPSIVLSLKIPAESRNLLRIYFFNRFIFQITIGRINHLQKVIESFVRSFFYFIRPAYLLRKNRFDAYFRLG